MPGLLMMEAQAAVDSPQAKKDRSHAQDSGLSATMSEGSAAVQNGAIVENGEILTTNGDHVNQKASTLGAEAAPELDQVWKDTPANKSFGTLIDRLAQQCFVDLNDCLGKMSELGDGSNGNAPPQVNGLAPQGAYLDTSEVSRQKKRILMDFAQDQRDRFTKTLVLSDWARNADGIAKVHGIESWQQTQDRSYRYAQDAIGLLKNRAVHFKTPAPNIDGAMEVLATGSVASVPDLGYIPPKPLSAKQLLSLLKDMNVALATRLTLHEDLPYHMQQYSISNGRVTFSVPGEFEVDLTVADEEETSPWYFIDFRFLFSPSSSVLNDTMRAHIELQANGALATKGLKGCYDLLHNFVLTHKINVLRNQAIELIRGKWFDCIKVEGLRRSFTIQYWTGVPGPKNWIEIGIVSGRTQKMHPVASRKATPRLSVRWFRRGQEVLDESLDIDWNELDVEVCLMQVIGKHCFGKLGITRDGLHAMTAQRGEDSILPPATQGSLSNSSSDFGLKVKLPSMEKSLDVRLDPVTGQFSISPPSTAAARSECVLNSDATIDVARVLASLICTTVQTKVYKQAEMLGWRPLQPQPSIKDHFGKDVLQRTVFGVPGWGDQWALGVGFGLAGEKWWAVQLQYSGSKDRNLNPLKEVIVAHAVSASIAKGGLSASTLLSIERLAVVQATYAVLTKQLREMSVPYTISQSESDRDDDNSSAVYIHFSPFMRTSQSWKSWAAEPIRISHLGMDDDDDGTSAQLGAQSSVQLETSLSLEKKRMTQLRRYLSSSKEQHVTLNSTGGMAVRLRVSFGEPFANQIQARLRSVEALDTQVSALHNLKCKITLASLSTLHFTYSTSPELSAELIFSKTDGTTRLRLKPSGFNPHQRTRVMLEQCLNRRDGNGFRLFVRALLLTLPLLNCFDRLEEAHLAKQTLQISKRGVTWFQFVYKVPLPAQTFVIRARSKILNGKAQVRWHVERLARDTSGLPEDLGTVLTAFWNSSGEGYFGLGNGIIADAKGITTVLEKLDEILRHFRTQSTSGGREAGEQH
ncbi:mediator complex subunit [Recurvomyces mirabilis]|uniref:Mediator of RNA polymerase II transcription subunit 14 n=1 Tax=Recurvomyces mirabilis TaxID=574656 RepID=A0AAE0WTD7_9PEZI|nr:mediator complex subunit [Recurvomyces mirabilis]KAK5159282.1 mediator complex subunit [Recurvomyces mirabilis]